MTKNTKVLVKHTLAVLKMPSKIGDRIIKAQFIQNKLTGNANFTVPYPANIVSLAQLGTDITALVAAETASKNRAPGATDARDAIMSTVIADLRSIMHLVQIKADTNPANAETIIMGAGYDVKGTSVKQKQQNAAKNSEVSGTVILTAEGTGAHEWQQSKDQVNIIHLPSTSRANTALSGLTPGEVWYFRNRKIANKNGQFNWSAWQRVMVS
jgi:hypothetical protein